MKFVCVSVALLAVFAATGYCDDDDYCSGPNDRFSCDRDECCVRSFRGNGYVCKDIGDDIGDACGGEYSCGCGYGLTCQRYSQTGGPFPRGVGSCQPAL